MNEVDIRITPALHPLVFGESEDPLVQQIASNFDSAYTALRKLHDARKVATKNPLLTESAAKLKIADLASKTMETLTKMVDRSRHSLEEAIKAIDNEMSQPFTDTGNPVSAEIRAHIKSLKAEDRMRLIRDAIENGDTRTVRAVLGGPAYLSGITQEMQKALTLQANKRYSPDKAKRSEHLQKALKRVDYINIQIINDEIVKGLGTTWNEINKLRQKQADLERAFA